MGLRNILRENLVKEGVRFNEFKFINMFLVIGEEKIFSNLDDVC